MKENTSTITNTDSSNNTTDYLIINFWDSKYNYGAMLTAYAMQEMIKKIGFVSKLMNFGERTEEKWYKNSHMETFAKNYLNITNKLDTLNKCKEAAKTCKGIIIGSDQVLRLGYIVNNISRYMLNFAGKETQRIAFSASFGVNKDEYILCEYLTGKIKEYMKKALQSFDYLSCRELSGKDIYKDVFGLDSDMILDPVFLADKESYDRIIEKSNKDYSGKIISYVLDEGEKHQELYKYFESKLNAECIRINVKEWHTEDWLKSIRDCKMLITDSFHGTCFALLYNKPFICFRNKDRGDTRFETLVNLFGIKDNFAYSPDEILNSQRNLNVDYEKVNKLINEKRANDLTIVEKVLKENYSNNPNAKINKNRNDEYLKGLYKHSKSVKIKNGLKCLIYGILSNLVFGKLKKQLRNKKYVLKTETNIYE